MKTILKPFIALLLIGVLIYVAIGILITPEPPENPEIEY